MKNYIFALRLISVLFLLQSCYESSVPIDKSVIKIDPKLIFKWEDQESKDIYNVKKIDDFNYKIDMYSQASGKTTKMNGYCSVIDGVTFLNIWDVNQEPKSKKYTIVKIEWIDESSFKIYPLTENIREQFDTSEKLKEFIRENMKDTYIYEDQGIFKRIK